MNLTTKLLSFLHRVFDKDQGAFLALRLRYVGTGMTWRIQNAVLTTVPVGGAGAPLTVDLRHYTLLTLVDYLAAQPGYEVAYIDHTELSLLGAVVLMDGYGDIGLSNGDHLYGYTSTLWAYMEANAVELQTAATQIGEALDQMATTTAAGEWLDELGSYYAVPRLAGELDAPYHLRIIAEVLRPRGNNVAMEAAISVFTGQTTTVVDVVQYTVLTPNYGGASTHNSSIHYNSAALPLYGLFDVQYGYDIINGGDIAPFAQVVRDLIGRLRDAGTHLRALDLRGSVLTDSLTAPTDGSGFPTAIVLACADTLTAPSDSLVGAITMGGFTDTLTAPMDSETLSITYGQTYSGLRYYNSAVLYNSGDIGAETL